MNSMITLVSKQSSQVAFPITSLSKLSSSVLPKPKELLIESGVAIFNFSGANVGVWARDTLVVPIGQAVPKANFLSGMACGSPASFSTNAQTVGVAVNQSQDLISVPVNVEGQGPNGVTFASGNISFSVPGFVTAANAGIPGMGCAVDSSIVTYSADAGKPIATFSVAVFGNATLLLRIAYTAHIVLGEPGIDVTTGSGGVDKS